MAGAGIHATTIFAVSHNGSHAMAGDGQVTLGNQVVMKHTAKKVRRLFNGKVIAGFAGSVADAFTLFEMFEGKLLEYNGNLQRASVELAKQWRGDKMLRQLEAMLLVMDNNNLLLVSGTGEVIEPDDGILAIGSGGNYALAAGRALKQYAGEKMTAEEIAKAALTTAADICVFTNHQIIVEVLGEMKENNLTPKQITEHLNKYIVGQDAAKKAVAVALRNRYRRQLLDEDMKNEVIPKNILMIGPTGVGKTEIARRIAKLTKAPFVKVEATKFTEVGYVGRDVESMVRDLVEAAIRIVKEEKMEEVKDQAIRLANDAIVKLLVPSLKKKNANQNPFEALFGGKADDDLQDNEDTEVRIKRSQIAEDLRDGKLEDEIVTVEVTEHAPSIFDALQGGGMESMGMNMQDALSSLVPKKKKKRKMKVKDARKVLLQEEASKLIDNDELSQIAIEKTEQSGIIFIDEMDKIANKNGGSASADVSREGVQRDILPIVEGSTVNTKYGAVKTDYILFIAAGAFHMSKPSDLIPELQGRFPIRVELEKLTKEDFVRILKEPQHSLTKQYEALLQTEGVTISFTDEAIERIGEIAYEVNQETDNIGARRLHTILEKILEELSFEASDISPAQIQITPGYIDQKLDNIVKNKDLSQFIL